MNAFATQSGVRDGPIGGAGFDRYDVSTLADAKVRQVERT